MIAQGRTRRGNIGGATRSATAMQSAAAMPPESVAHLVPLEPGLYAFALATATRWREPLPGFAVPAVHIAPLPAPEPAVDIADAFGRRGSWLGGRHTVLFVKAPAAGGTALVTGYLGRDPEAAALELQIRRIAAPTGEAAPAGSVQVLRLDDPNAERDAAAGLEVVAHINRRGDVRFVDAAWIGRLGPGLSIEAFTVLPRDAAVAGAIEYKGLIAGGAETPWLGSGSTCGTRGRGMPLLGFAVRQKAGRSAVTVDCEYTGYFRSGRTAGPIRNGAPCRSALDNDPLEGLQLRFVPHRTRRAG